MEKLLHPKFSPFELLIYKFFVTMYKIFTRLVFFIFLMPWLGTASGSGLNTIYNYADVTIATDDNFAYLCDVDVFPFQGKNYYRNSIIEATDSQYTAIAARDELAWQIPNPGLGDEILMWFEMFIEEDIAAIAQIDLAFIGNAATSETCLKIFVLTAGADWIQVASWVQVGSEQLMSAGENMNMTRSIRSNIEDYIDPATGSITWAVYQYYPSGEAIEVDYVEMVVLDEILCDKSGPVIYLPGDLDENCYVDMKDLAVLVGGWLEISDFSFGIIDIPIVNGDFSTPQPTEYEWLMYSNKLPNYALGYYSQGWTDYKPDWQSADVHGLIAYTDWTWDTTWDVWFPGVDRTLYGSQIAYLKSAAGFSQTLDANLEADTSYYLEFDLGYGADRPGDYGWLVAQFVAGSGQDEEIVFSGGVDMSVGKGGPKTSGSIGGFVVDDVGMVVAAADNWVHETLTYTTSSNTAGLGLPLTVRIFGDHGMRIDNIRLSAEGNFVCDANIAGDTNTDCKVDSEDFAAFGEYWQQCSDPGNSDCDGDWPRRYTGIWYEPWYSMEGTYLWIDEYGIGSDEQLIGDVDGDGKADAIVFNYGQWQAAISNGDGFGNPALWHANHGAGSNSQMLGDVDGDGKADAVAYSNGQWQVALSDGSSFGSPALWQGDHGNGSNTQMLGDVDGDGREDAVAFFSGTGNWHVALSNGSGFDSSSLWTSGDGPGSNAQMLGDVDGDGKADAVAAYTSNGNWYVALSDGSGFDNYTQWLSGHGIGYDSQLLGDINGDGKADAVAYFAGICESRGDLGRWQAAYSNGGSFNTPFRWKDWHGNSRINVNGQCRASDRPMLADTYGTGCAAPVAFYDNEGWWKIMPHDKYNAPAKMNVWEAWGINYIPLTLGEFRYYDTYEADVIDEQLAMLEDAYIDFLAFDTTNHIEVGWILDRALFVCERIKQWNAGGLHRPIRYVANVGNGWGANLTENVAIIEQQAGVVWEEFMNNPDLLSSDYFHLYDPEDGQTKPLLIVYTWTQCRLAWENYTGDKSNTSRFTIRWAEGARGWEHRNDVTYGWWGWSQVEGPLPNEHCMTVLPGHDNRGDEFYRTRPTRRNKGVFYQRGWELILNQVPKPEAVMIVNFNDYTEMSAVAPADTSTLDQVDESDEKWYNENDQLDPNMYWDMTRYYNRRYKTEF